MAGYDWDPAEEVLRERELEDALVLANDRPAPSPVPDLLEPQDALSPVTQVPALASTHLPEADLARSNQSTTSSTFPAQVAAADIPAVPVCRRLRRKVPPPLAFVARAQRKRLRTKVRPPPAYVDFAQHEASVAAPQINIDNSALATEAWSEVTVLSPDAQRQHVHYTHVRTTKATYRQPSSFTLAGSTSTWGECMRKGGDSSV